MKKFLVLYRSSVPAKEQMMTMTPEQRKAGMDAWASWGERAGSALVEWGAPIGDSTLLKGTPGPDHIGGYSIVQAESLDAATRLVHSHPHFDAPNASIELLELLPTPGM